MCLPPFCQEGGEWVCHCEEGENGGFLHLSTREKGISLSTLTLYDLCYDKKYHQQSVATPLIYKALLESIFMTSASILPPPADRHTRPACCLLDGRTGVLCKSPESCLGGPVPSAPSGGGGGGIRRDVEIAVDQGRMSLSGHCTCRRLQLYYADMLRAGHSR